jgi:NADH-quinone oxidoreductase subunit L
MVMAVGLAAPGAAMFHLATHAFFKALLFLGAGSVIHALHHEQDIWKMGGLKSKLPTTYRTFLIGTLALCGVPPLSGFYSKDGILAAASPAGSHPNPFLFILAVGVAALTAFYMARLFFVAFLGKAKDHCVDHAHESPGVMIWPLRILGTLSVIAGFMGLEQMLGRFFGDEHAHSLGYIAQLFAPFGHAPLAAFFGLFATVLGFSAAYALYANASTDPLPAKLGFLSRAMRDRFYFDEIYSWIIRLTHEAMSFVASWIDRWFVAGLMVRGTHGTTELFGRALRLVQTGNLQTYAFLLVLGVAVLLFIILK